MVKAGLKAVYRRAAAAFGPARRGSGASLVVLTYHRVLPNDHGDSGREQPGMVVSPETFAMHLEVLGEHFEIVSLEDWLRRKARGELDRGRYAAITFDDGWADNYEYGWPVLARAGLPATIFLVSGMVGTRQQFWPNRLARLLTRPELRGIERLAAGLNSRLAELSIDLSGLSLPLNRDALDRLIESSKKASDSDMHELCDLLESWQSGHDAASAGRRDLLSWGQVREMCDTGLVTLGSHTRFHTRLRSGLEASVETDEIAGSRDEIRQQTGVAPAVFCYPNGDVSPSAAARVRESYEGAVLTERGWNRPDTDAYSLRRIGVHEDISASPTHFLARLSGWPGL